MKKLSLLFTILLFCQFNSFSQVNFYSDKLAHTFSIVARDPETGEMGVAVQSHWFSVGSIVAWGEAGVGVVATQSFVNPSFGPRGLELLKQGKTAERPKDKEKDGIISLKPGVDFLQVDTGKDNWVPHICYVEEIDVDTKELQYVYKVEGSLTGQLDILIAGKENAKLKFFWNVWRRKTDNNVVAWKENIADAVVPAEKELKNPPAATEPFYPERIDPENIDERRLFKAELPADVNDADTKTWQAVLYATYEWEHEEPEGSGDTVKTIIKSNPILFYGTGSGT